jgi:hypothetical protein
MDLKQVNPAEVEAAVRKQISVYRVLHTVAGHVRDWMQGLGERKPNERLVGVLRLTIEAQFPGSYVRLSKDTSAYLKSMGITRFELEVGGFGDSVHYTLQCKGDGGPDIEYAMTSHMLYEDFARALEDRIRDIPAMTQDFNIGLGLLKSVALRCKAREGLGVQRGATFSPMAPLSDFFRGYEFMER